jgi:dTMP kinase
MMRPLFLSLDGIDGTGKSTQIRLLADWLRARGASVVTCNDPGGTPLGERLREILLSHADERCPMAEALMFMASRAELLERIVRPTLAAGQIVLLDRYLLATLVYQGYGCGLNVESLGTLVRLAAGRLEPDLTLVLDLPVEQAQRRRGRDPDRMESRTWDFHERVRQGFLIEAAKEPDRIRVIDASKTVEEIHAAICTEVGRVLESHSRS